MVPSLPLSDSDDFLDRTLVLLHLRLLLAHHHLRQLFPVLVARQSWGNGGNTIPLPANATIPNPEICVCDAYSTRGEETPKVPLGSLATNTRMVDLLELRLGRNTSSSKDKDIYESMARGRKHSRSMATRPFLDPARSKLFLSSILVTFQIFSAPATQATVG